MAEYPAYALSERKGFSKVRLHGGLPPETIGKLARILGVDPKELVMREESR